MNSIQFPGSLNAAAFLEQYWQKAPLFMPQAWPGFESPLSADELAGLALEEDVPSRIIEQHNETSWSVRDGPFTHQDFADLETKTWTLLVTDVEKYLPDLAAYVRAFRFIPDWRFDDLMISYAPPGGSVGPHMDDYDTFLLQAEGDRTWHLETKFRDLPMPESELISGTDLRLIKAFEITNTYHCKPGDILYLPPRLGHYGIAKTDSLTWSFGFKAPRFNDLLMDYLDHFEDQNEYQRFTDQDLVLQSNPGEISAQQLGALKNWFEQQFKENDAMFSRWIAKSLSGWGQDDDDAVEIRASNSLPQGVALNPFIRINFIRQADKTYLYAQGEEYEVSLAFAKALTEKKHLKVAQYTQDEQLLISTLLRTGVLTDA